MASVITFDEYICPVHHSQLVFAPQDGKTTSRARLVCEAGDSYPIQDAIPILVPTDLLSDEERAAQAEYDASAESKYDAAVEWQFRSFFEDEDAVRERMVDLLDLQPNARVLEIGSGTGRDSFRIARRLGEQGSFFAQDLSEQMVFRTFERLKKLHDGIDFQVPIECFVSTARFLPFRDGFFDALFHFGGFNNFSEPARTLAEMTRVVKEGGRVVFGDEALPPWLRGTEFGKILITNNPLFEHQVPLGCLPESARDVTLRWVLGGCFYVISFRVGSGPPPLDLDLPHKGWRGGSMRTRYYGRLEGVTPEVRELAITAAKARNISVHQWLDETLRSAAERELPADDRGEAANRSR